VTLAAVRAGYNLITSEEGEKVRASISHCHIFYLMKIKASPTAPEKHPSIL
jgi:hypothetical protein